MSPERWERVQELFQEVLERSSEERRAFLAEACGEDAPLRAEVESLIASHCEPWSLLDGATAAPRERSRNDRRFRIESSIYFRKAAKISRPTAISRRTPSTMNSGR